MSEMEEVRQRLHGFMFPDPRINTASPWLAHSSFTQWGPYLDVPKPEVHTKMVLQASGDISDPVSMIVRAQRGGMPKAGGAGFVFRDTEDEGDRYRGWDTYAHRTHSEVLRTGGPAGFYPHFDNFGGATTNTGNIVACGDSTPFFIGDSAFPSVYTMSRIDGVWSEPVVVYDENKTINQTHPVIVVLPSGKLLLFHWVFDAGAATANMRMWWSEDDGASWTLGQYSILPESIDTTAYQVKRIAAAYINGQVLIVAHVLSIQELLLEAFRDQLIQWASNDLGASCSLVIWWKSSKTTLESAVAGDAGRGYPVLLIRQGTLQLFFLAHGKPLDTINADDEPLISLHPFMLSLGSAYDPISSAGTTMVRAQGDQLWGETAILLDGEDDPNYITVGELTGIVDELGVIYLYGIQDDGAHRSSVARSDDGGFTWAAMGDLGTGYQEIGLTISTDVTYARAIDEVIGVGASIDAPAYNTYINYSDPPTNGLEYPDHRPLNHDPSLFVLKWTSFGHTYTQAGEAYDSGLNNISADDDKVFFTIDADNLRMNIQFDIHDSGGEPDGYYPDEGSKILLSYSYAVDTIYRLVFDGIYLEVHVPYNAQDYEAATLIRDAIRNHPTLDKLVEVFQSGPSEFLTITSRVRGYDMSLFVGPLIEITGSDSGVERKGSWHHAGGFSYPSQMFAIKSGSRVAMLHKVTSVEEDEDDIQGYPGSMLVSWLGGFTSNTMPGKVDLRDESGQLQWNHMWSGFNLPQFEGWDVFGGGTEALTDQNLLNLGPGLRTYSRTWAGTADSMVYGVLMHAVVAVVDTDPTLSSILTVTISDGDRSQTVVVYAGSLSIRVKDLASATTSTIPFASTGETIEILICACDGKAQVWARVYDGNEDRLFDVIVADFELTDGSSSENAISWGSETGAETSSWSRAEYLELHAGWQAPSQGFSNPVDLFTKQISTDRSSPTSFPQGVQLVALSGPAYVGDYWLLQTLYRYPVSNLGSVLKPSPRDFWRSTGIVENRIAFLLSNSTSTPTRFQSNAIGVYVAGANFRTFRLEGMLADSSWETIRSFDLAGELVDLPYVREGTAVMPADDADSGDFNIFDRALAGRVVDLGDGALRLIGDNGAGAWTGPDILTMQKPTIILADGDDSEPTSGTCSIWSPDQMAILFTTTSYVALRFVIPEQQTRDGYFQAGAMWAGPVSFMGQPYGHAWSLEEAGANVEMIDFPDSRDLVRELGPSRRTWALAWAEGVNQSEVLQRSPQSRYVTHKEDGAPLGLVCDTPRHLQGMIRRLRGPKTPVVFFAGMRLTIEDEDLAICTDRELMLLCRIMGPITRENVWGGEGDIELQRVSSFHLQEIP